MGKGDYMTKREVDRVEVFARIDCKQLTKTKAAEELGLSLRQIIRLYKEYKRFGKEALRSKRRGKPSNHRIPQEVRNKVVELVSMDIYKGFRPTLMTEKIHELYNIKLSHETVRQIMIQADKWKPGTKKRPVAHQQRQRRARYGELIQIDGSPHAWFEERGERCTLLVYIDDATGQTFGKFVDVESTAAYMDITREYIMRFGIPRSFYSDKHSIFRVNREDCFSQEMVTQFGRALKELEIELICANSPQAKGRVERANKTLQDRLVKELRLAHVSTIDEANKFLEETNYWGKHNARFSVTAMSPEDAHKPSPSKKTVSNILCFKNRRKISKNFELQYNNIIYQVNPEDQLNGLQGRYVFVHEQLDGTISIEYNGRKIGFKEFYKQAYVGSEVNSKEIDRFLRGRKPRVVSPNHSWKSRWKYSSAT